MNQSSPSLIERLNQHQNESTVILQKVNSGQEFKSFYTKVEVNHRVLFSSDLADKVAKLFE